MTIPVRNVFLLLCYAWDVLDEADVLDVDTLEHHSTQELMARVLVNGTRHVMRRGLEQQYREVREDLSCLRGRVDLQDSLKRLLLPKAIAHVIHEEMSPDFLPNQIIKSTVRVLMEVDDLSSPARAELVGLHRKLRGVSEIRVTSNTIARVQLHGNNRSYRLLMEVCNMVLESLIPDEEGNGRRFRDFTRDEQKMRILFQKFVTNFLVREQSQYRVAAESFTWQEAVRIGGERIALPRMTTDLVLTAGARRIVVDTKFTSQTFRNYYGSSSVRTEHLYQLWAYITNLHVKVGRQGEVHGVLLYPTISADLDEQWVIQGHHIRVLTVDLRTSFESIRNRLLSIGAVRLGE